MIEYERVDRPPPNSRRGRSRGYSTHQGCVGTVIIVFDHATILPPDALPDRVWLECGWRGIGIDRHRQHWVRWDEGMVSFVRSPSDDRTDGTTVERWLATWLERHGYRPTKPAETKTPGGDATP